MSAMIRSIAFLAVLCVGSASAAQVTLVTVGYPPYYGPGLPNNGPIAEIVTEAYARAGYQVTVEFMPWVRAMQRAQTGKADGLLGGWYSKEREQWFVFSAPLPGNELVIYKRIGDRPQRFTSYEALTPYRIGTVKGYRNPDDFEAADLRREAAPSDRVNLVKLANNRVDLILIDKATAKFILDKELAEYRDRLEPIEPPLERPPLHVLISKQAVDFEKKIEAFDEGLKILEREGAVEAILKRHNL